MNKYPIYIVSKGRSKTSLTANFFKKDGIKFLIAVEPQEYDDYCREIGSEYILKLPFSNLGVGSYPARNYCWEHSISIGAKKHWIFDDNIRGFRRIVNGKKIPCASNLALEAAEEFNDRYLNVGITSFNYSTFVVPGNSDKKPFYLNCHAYSALLIDNNMEYRWRLKYNEDVDLCLQVLHNGLCTILLNAFTIDKTSTSVKMKGGNQTELYQGNKSEKKVLKAKSLEEIWPQYAKTIFRFNRPHHYVDWKAHFKHSLIRNPDIDWEALKQKKVELNLFIKKDIKNDAVRQFAIKQNAK